MGKLIFAFILVLGGFFLSWLLSRLAAQVEAQSLTRPTQSSPYADQDRAKARLVRLGGRVGFGALSAVAVLIVAFSTFVVVATGHVGVVTEFGQVESTVLTEGLNIVAPWKVVNPMSVQIQKKTDKFSTGSKDSQPVYVVMTINYRLKSLAAATIFKEVGYDYPAVIIQPAEQEVLKAHTALYPASDMLNKRPALKAEVQTDLSQWLVKYGLELTEVAIADIDFEKDYKDAIAAKQVAEQKAEQKRYEVTQAVRQAEIAKATAEGQANAAREAAKGAADATRATAQAEADALRLKGTAQADYNQRVASSLTSELVSQQWIEAWRSGGAQVPTFNMDGNGGSSFLMQLPAAAGLKKQEKSGVKTGVKPVAAHAMTVD